jgi:hypothetical protein
MVIPIYASEEHKQAIEKYLLMCKDFAKDISTETKYNNYLNVLEIILEYHNNYGSGIREDNYWDWLMIIPINVSIMTQGFFAGIETKSKASRVHSYKVILSDMLEQLVATIETIEPNHE